MHDICLCFSVKVHKVLLYSKFHWKSTRGSVFGRRIKTKGAWAYPATNKAHFSKEVRTHRKVFSPPPYLIRSLNSMRMNWSLRGFIVNDWSIEIDASWSMNGCSDFQCTLATYIICIDIYTYMYYWSLNDASECLTNWDVWCWILSIPFTVSESECHTYCSRLNNSIS